MSSYEARRHLGILDTRLATHRYMLGDTYNILDMGFWGLGARAAIHSRRRMPGRKCRICSASWMRSAPGRPQPCANALKDRHAFKTDMDEEARRNLFPQNMTFAA